MTNLKVVGTGAAPRAPAPKKKYKYVPKPKPLQGARETGLVLCGTAAAIGGLAIVVNAQTGWNFGTTPLASATFSGLSAAADVLALALPTAGSLLWAGKKRWLAGAAWATWGLAAALATLSSVGFASLNISDATAERTAVVTTAATLTAQHGAQVEAARAVAEAASAARAAECKSGHGPRCRAAEAVEVARLAELRSAVAAPLPAAAPIAESDPQVAGAVRLAGWFGVRATAADVGNLRLAALGLLPNLAGLVLAVGVALRGRAPKKKKAAPKKKAKK